MNVDFQVCVSDNCSTDETEDIVRQAQKEIKIKYQKNSSNLGFARNLLNVVEMADGEYIWFLGDDDLLVPFAVETIAQLLSEHEGVDYYFINAFHLETEYVLSYKQPFDTINLPKEMKLWSTHAESGGMEFMDLINPKISFDFLGGMFLSVFRRECWIRNVDVLDMTAISTGQVFENFDNTYPHVKLFAHAFAKSKAYFYAKPLTVILRGAREWSPMFPLIRSVRTLEILEEFRKNGLPYFQYLRCRNFALNHFIPDLLLMYIDREHSGYKFINPYKLILENSLFPNFYLSILFSIGRKVKLFITKIIG
jgi:glycosyltransferase involved in cell wall biosynthesis